MQVCNDSTANKSDYRGQLFHTLTACVILLHQLSKYTTKNLNKLFQPGSLYLLVIFGIYIFSLQLCLEMGGDAVQ